MVTCFAHAGIFATSNDERQRSLAWLAGVLMLFAMWIYFALRILLLISVKARATIRKYPGQPAGHAKRVFLAASPFLTFYILRLFGTLGGGPF